MGRKSNAEIANDKLRAEMDELKEMMKQMMASQNNQSDTSNDKKSASSIVADFEEEDEIVDIAPQTLIHVTSLFTGGMSLKGSHGKIIRFERFGQRMPITFEDLNYAVSNDRYLAEGGYFYIHSEDAIKLLYLQEEYDKIVDAKTIENIINLPSTKIEELYSSVSDNIKDSIMDIIVRGIQQNKPKYQDRNKISFLSKLIGKDLEVIARSLNEYNTK